MYKLLAASLLFGNIARDNDKLYRIDEEGNTEELTEAEYAQVNSKAIEQEITAHMDEYMEGIATMLDSKAGEYGFDSILSARSYAGYTNDFQTIAVALGTWATSCWVKAEELKTAALANNSMPTLDEVISQMPEFTYVG